MVTMRLKYTAEWAFPWAVYRWLAKGNTWIWENSYLDSEPALDYIIKTQHYVY